MPGKKRQMTEAERFRASLPYALDWPTGEPFYLNGEDGPRPITEIPDSVSLWLHTKALAVGVSNLDKADCREVSFLQWELGLIVRGSVPIPHWVMEKLRAQEEFGLHNEAELKPFIEKHIHPLMFDHESWGMVQYYELWPEICPRPYQWVFDEYEKLQASGYADNWFAVDYSAIPSLDPRDLLPDSADNSAPNPSKPILLAPGGALAEATGIE